MITITYHRAYHRLTLQGHAGAGEKGEDIVCASATMLAYTLSAAVANMSGAKQVRDCVIRLEEGDIEISCRCPSRFKATITLIFDTICAGYELLARNYPDNISYEVRG